MTVSDFDSRIAKLQEKILKEVGEPIPDEVRLVAGHVDGSRKPVRRLRPVGRGYVIKSRTGGEGPFKGTPTKLESEDKGIRAVVLVGPDNDRAEIQRLGKNVILRFEDYESARDAIGVIKANRTIAVQGADVASTKESVNLSSVKRVLGLGKFSKK